MFDINHFFKCKSDLSVPKIIFLDIHVILYSELFYAHSVKVGNQNSKRTGLVASEVLDLS